MWAHGPWLLSMGYDLCCYSFWNSNGHICLFNMSPLVFESLLNFWYTYSKFMIVFSFLTWFFQGREVFWNEHLDKEVHSCSCVRKVEYCRMGGNWPETVAVIWVKGHNGLVQSHGIGEMQIRGHIWVHNRICNYIFKLLTFGHIDNEIIRYWGEKGRIKDNLRQPEPAVGEVCTFLTFDVPAGSHADDSVPWQLGAVCLLLTVQMWPNLYLHLWGRAHELLWQPLRAQLGDGFRGYQK